MCCSQTVQIALHGNPFEETGRGIEREENYTRRPYCSTPGIAKRYPQSVNRNIFYIIGVIVVIIVVLKVLGLF